MYDDLGGLVNHVKNFKGLIDFQDVGDAFNAELFESYWQAWCSFGIDS